MGRFFGFIKGATVLFFAVFGLTAYAASPVTHYTMSGGFASFVKEEETECSSKQLYVNAYSPRGVEGGGAYAYVSMFAYDWCTNVYTAISGFWTPAGDDVLNIEQSLKSAQIAIEMDGTSYIQHGEDEPIIQPVAVSVNIDMEGGNNRSRTQLSGTLNTECDVYTYRTRVTSVPATQTALSITVDGTEVPMAGQVTESFIGTIHDGYMLRRKIGACATSFP